MNSALRHRCPLHLWRPNEGYTSANEFVGPSGALQRGYIRTPVFWTTESFRGMDVWIGVVVIKVAVPCLGSYLPVSIIIQPLDRCVPFCAGASKQQEELHAKSDFP